MKYFDAMQICSKLSDNYTDYQYHTTII